MCFGFKNSWIVDVEIDAPIQINSYNDLKDIFNLIFDTKSLSIKA